MDLSQISAGLNDATKGIQNMMIALLIFAFMVTVAIVIFALKINQ